MTLLAVWGSLTWLAYLLDARGTSVWMVKWEWRNKMLGHADLLMLTLLPLLVASLAWLAVAIPLIESLSGGGVSIDPLR